MLLLTNKTIEKLQHDLVRDGLIDLDILISVQNNAQKHSVTLAEELIKQKIMSEEDLLRFIEKKLHIPYVELDNYSPDINCLHYLTTENAQRYNIFPLFKIEDVLTIAMADPLDLFAINNLFELNNITIEPVICSANSIQNAINKYYLNKTSQETKWQDMIIADNISDETIKTVISSIFSDAIKSNTQNIIFENSQNALNICFDKNLVGYVPSILSNRFLFEFKNFINLNTEIENVAQTTTFIYFIGNTNYSCFIAIFYTQKGFRVSINIHKITNDLKDFNLSVEEIINLCSTPKLIGLKLQDAKKTLAYTLANVLNNKNSILFIENKSLYDIQNVTQIETNNNTSIYFDEIIKQIEYQNYDIIFWEKIYQKEQLDILKLLSKEKIIIIQTTEDLLEYCDYIL